jgi:large subunit ribosomal protein L25
MDTQTLTAEVRSGSGKGPARQLRMRGLIPAVFYGKGVQPSSMAVSPKELAQALTGPLGRNQPISLKVAGQDELALVKELQIHPISREPRHVDFYRIQADQPVAVEVPFRTTGKAAGVVKGGEQHTIYRKLPVRVLPGKIPVVIEHDVTNVDVNEVVQVKDLKLPDGVEIALGPDRTLVAMYSEEKKKRLHAEEEPTVVPGAVAAEGAAPAAGAAAGAPGAAPAAGAAAAPAKEEGGKKEKK